MAKFTALELTQLLDRLVNHLISNDIIDPNPAEDIRLLREAAARCDKYADELDRRLQESD